MKTLIKTNTDMRTIKIDKMVFTDFVWMSARYCIGRHTIAAGTHAQDIWRVVMMNPSCMSKGRKEFEARDIREYISNYMHSYPNIEVSNAYNDRIKADAYTLYLDYRKAHPECDPEKTKFYIDCTACTVDSEPWEKKGKYQLPFTDDMDLESWCDLAACLAGEIYVVSHEYKGNAGQSECIRSLSVNRYQGANTVEEHYHKLDNWSIFIAPEYITKVERI